MNEDSEEKSKPEAIHQGELPAAQLGPRHIIVLRRDFEDWLRRHAVRPSAHASARVDEVLAREEHAAQTQQRTAAECSRDSAVRNPTHSRKGGGNG